MHPHESESGEKGSRSCGCTIRVLHDHVNAERERGDAPQPEENEPGCERPLVDLVRQLLMSWGITWSMLQTNGAGTSKSWEYVRERFRIHSRQAQNCAGDRVGCVAGLLRVNAIVTLRDSRPNPISSPESF